MFREVIFVSPSLVEDHIVWSIDKIRDITPLPRTYLSHNLSHCQGTKIIRVVI